MKEYGHSRPEIDMAETFYPRDELVGEICRAESPLLVISGDSGIGKSALLQRAAVQHDGPSSLVSVRFSQSASHAILSALAQCAGEAAGRTDSPSDVLRAVVLATKSLAQRSLNSLPDKITTLFLSLIDVTGVGLLRQAAEAYGREIHEALPNTVLEGVGATVEPLAVDTVVEIAGTVLNFLDPEERIAISLDGAERFTEEQLRFLVDFADASPPKCRTRITFRTALHDEVERLRWLEGSSAVCSALEVPPLSEAEVHEWLELARLPASLAPAATRGSGGYPLHLVDWISQQQKGEPVSPPRQAHFAEITKRSWAALGSATRRSAARLVVLNDPLPSEQLARLVGVDEDQWASLVEELALARLLSVRIEGQLWFHEERRAAIFEVLTDEERERNHARAVSFLAELVSAEGDDALLAELALQVENVATLREDPRIDALFGLAPAELSVLAAALELAEPGIGGSVGVFEVLSHWGDRWKRGDDPGLALQTLVLKDVVRVVPSDSGPLIDLGGERLWYLAAAGVCRVRLGRPVVRSISSYLFKSVVAPAAVGLVGARYGVGRLSFSYMADLARSVSPRPDAPVLAARLSYGSTSFYACVSFQSAHDRNLAHHALQAAGERYALEERVRLREALDLPTGRFRTKGFLAALDRVRPDKTSRTASNPSSTDPSEWLELRAEATDVFAEIALGAEALAGEATGGARFLWTQTDDRYLEIELRGDGPRAQRIPEAHLAGVSDLFEVASPTFVERLTEELGVDAVLRRVSVGRLPDVRADPVRFQFQEIVDQFRAFNRSQQAVVVTVESEELTSAIAAAISARWELATRLYQALSARGLAVDPLEPRRHEVLVVLDRPMRSWVAGAHAWIRCSQWPATSDRDEVNVRCVEGILARDKRNSFRFELPPDAEDKHSWRDWEGALGGSDAVFDHGIAELLGYEVDDVTTTWLSELGA